jgi:tripartite-type tricarboxylate transporter receptor subunit TctC
VLRAPADGHALEIGGMSQHAMNGSLYKGLSFDPMADFVPAAMLAHVINVIAVAKDMPVNTFPELIAYIRAHPGKVNYSSGGIGSHNHLTLALLAKMANLDMTHVPYKGGGPAVQALVQGEVNMFAGGASLLVSQSRAGRVKLIAVTESKRSALLPDLPSASETIPGFEVSNWYGVFVRSGVPGPIVNQINQEVNRILQSPDTQEQLRSYFMSHEALSPADMKRLLQAEHKRWTETIKAMNITSE